MSPGNGQKLHRQVALECAAAIIGDAESAEVFLLSLDGLLADQPSPAVLERRLQVLAERFVPRTKARANGSKGKR